MIGYVLSALLLLIAAIPADAQQSQPAQVNGCQYNATPPVKGDKQTVSFQCDTNGKLLTTTTPASGSVQAVTVQPASTSTVAVPIVPAAASQALASNQVLKASAGNLYSFEVSADSTLSSAAWWIMIFDATSLPIDGAVTPAKCYAMPSGATGFNAAFSYPIRFTTGIVIGVSTNGCFTKAASTHAFISGDAQ